MIFEETLLAGAYIIDINRLEDNRGFFARTYCKKEFSEHNLLTEFPQCNVSFNRAKGTLRGMHYQAAPFEEGKLVRCTQGKILDVIVDLRPDSPTYCKWISVELSAENRRALYIPGGFAHGFQTLQDNSEVFYQMTATYEPTAARGVRWNDPAFDIEWPITPPVLSVKDEAYPNYIL